MFSHSLSSNTSRLARGLLLGAVPTALALLALSVLHLAPNASEPSTSPAASPPDVGPAAIGTLGLAQLPLPKPERVSPQAPHAPEHASLPSGLEVRGAVALGDRWFVMRQPISEDSPGQSELGPREPTAKATELVLLTQGQTLLVNTIGAAEHAHYTLASAAGVCQTRALGSVSVQLDAGEPRSSALGPRWLADEVVPCPIAPPVGMPALAVVGQTPVTSSPGLPQRVIGSSPTGEDCEAPPHEFVDTVLRIGSHELGLMRSSSDVDSLKLVDLADSERVLREVRVSLYWDDHAEC